MQVTMLLFAHVRDLIGEERCKLDLRDEADVTTALEALASAHPCVRPLLPGLAAAIGDRYVPHDYVLHDGDELAVIPPVSGG